MALGLEFVVKDALPGFSFLILDVLVALDCMINLPAAGDDLFRELALEQNSLHLPPLIKISN